LFQANAAVQKCEAAFFFVLMMEKLREQLILEPVVMTIPADLLTPLAVYLTIARQEPFSFLLESVEGNSSVARYSFIGAAPKFRLRTRGKEAELFDSKGSRPISQNSFEFLRSHFSAHKLYAEHDLPPFAGGAIGYIGFDCVDWFEPRLDNNTAEADLMFFDSIIAFDHVRQEIKIITLSSDQHGFNDCGEAERQNEKLRNVLDNGVVRIPAHGEVLEPTEPGSTFEKYQFEAAVRGIKELINAGECYQAVLSRCTRRKTNAAPVGIYRALRSLNPSPYMFLLQMDGRAIIGSSPETLIRSFGGKLEYRPIAGTRPRGQDAVEDRDLAEEMRSDPKEVAEHVMLVDLGRNDLGRVSEFGSVSVDQLMGVEQFSHVQHLVSKLSANLQNEKDQFDAFAACFPAGTVSGAPKVRAVEIIHELEPEARGIYAGAVGYFDYAGNMDTCIAIRTIVLENGIAKIQTGAGIVADSVPELEYLETVNKAKGMLRAIEIAEAAT
jgi:anthranilate synthase component I